MGMGVLIAQGMFGERTRADPVVRGSSPAPTAWRESRRGVGGPQLPPGRAGEGPGADTGQVDVRVGAS